jgi:hypothetical protein
VGHALGHAALQGSWVFMGFLSFVSLFSSYKNNATSFSMAKQKNTEKLHFEKVPIISN